MQSTTYMGTYFPFKFQFEENVKILKHGRNCELIRYAIKSLSVA